jgi:hypothetical protein
MVLKANYTWSNKVPLRCILVVLFNLYNMFFSGISADWNPAHVSGYPSVVENIVLKCNKCQCRSWHFESFMSIFISDQDGNVISRENNYSNMSNLRNKLFLWKSCMWKSWEPNLLNIVSCYSCTEPFMFVYKENLRASVYLNLKYLAFYAMCRCRHYSISR